MQVYNEDYIPDVCGFTNTGVLCYLNTLVQALLSCSAFNQHMLENKNLFVTAASKGNTIGLLYIKILEENNISMNANNVMRYKDKKFTIRQCNASTLLRGIIDLRKRNKSSSNLLHHQQESCSEGLIFMIEALTDVDPTIADLFNIRYKMDIVCRVCKDKKEGPQEKSNITFQLFEEDPIIQESLTTKETIQDYISRHINIPEDYKCENCGAKNEMIPDANGIKKVKHCVKQYYRLARISSIIILVFNKYEEKKVKFFPDSLDFEAKNGFLHYELITQVEHFGTRHGGHYYTKCRRPTPDGFAQFIASKRQEYVENGLQRLEKQRSMIINKLNSEKRKGYVTPETIEKLNMVDQKIEITKNNEPPEFDDDIVFQLNDSSVSVDPNGFKPTKNTYIAIYHLV